jgi:hypothetical protein
MSTKTNKWTKEEFHTYILLICANADSDETEEEIDLIKRKVSTETFERIHEEFTADSEDERIEKVDDNIHLHDYTNIEMAQLRREMYEIFFADCDFKMMERNLDRIFDNILY